MIITDIIKAYITGGEYALPDGCDINTVCAVSKRHDLAHLIAGALEKQNLLPEGELGSSLKKQKLLAIMRREQLDFEQERICALLQSENIPFIALKGAVLKTLYPEKWMRTSCDVDILIKPEDKESAVERILSSLDYTQESVGERDISLVSKSSVNLELHFSINCDNAKLNTLLARVWEFAVKGEGSEYLLTNEFFVFYHIAHMLVHFTEGGCGIRPFIDLWLYKSAKPINEDVLKNMLLQTECLEFYKGVTELCGAWFESKPYSSHTALLEEYIISGGVYGSRENLGATGRHKKGGRAKYLLSRIFMPKEKLRLVYPKIDKYPVLIPYYWVKRWFTLFDKNTFKSAKSELSGDKKAESTAELFTYLGL